MKSFPYIAALVFAATLTTTPTLAATLGLDTSFGTNGIVQSDYGLHQDDYGDAVLVQPDGKLVTAGETCGTGTSNCEITLARYLPDGSLDTSFGSGGMALHNLGTGSYTASYTNAVALLPDGKLLIVGEVENPNTFDGQIMVARFNPGGSLDAGFGTDGVVYLDAPGGAIVNVAGLAIATDGSFYVDGQAETNIINGGDEQEYAAHFKADGSLDTGFGNGGFVSTDVASSTNVTATALALASDGGIYVTGGYVDTSNTQQSYVLKYTSGGQLDTTFGNSGIVTFDAGGLSQGNLAWTLTMQSDGKALLSGTSGYPGSEYYYLVRLNPDGTFDDSFGSGGTYLSPLQASSTEFDGLLVAPDGTIWAGGTTSNGSTDAFYAQAFDKDGTPIGEYVLGGFYDSDDYSNSSLAMQPDGKLIATADLQPTSSSDYDAGLLRFAGTLFTLTPAAFSFMDQTGVDLNATITSNALTVSGLSNGVSVPVTVTGGEYSINGGAWTTDPGFTQNGDEIAVRHTSAGSYSTQTTTTLTVGGYEVPNNPQIVLGSPVSADFTSTTEAATPSGSGGGGGSFGPFALLGLLFLALVSLLLRSRHIRFDPIREDTPLKSHFFAIIFVTFMLGSIVTTTSALANPGDIDTNFNGGLPTILDDNPGVYFEPYAAAVNPINSDILWAGGTNLGVTSGIMFVYTPDGALDSAVGGGSGQISLDASQAGFPGGSLGFSAVAVDGQGRILVSGFVEESGNTTADMILARFKPDGVLDTSFGASGTGIVLAPLNNYAFGTGLSLTADGHILVNGGAETNIGGTDFQLTVWRYNADGTSDTSFGSGGYVQIAGLSDSQYLSCIPALQPDGKLIVGCSQTAAQVWTLTRLNIDGSLDTNFGNNGFWIGCSTCSLGGIALAPDGGLVVSYAYTTSPYAGYVFRLNADGSRDYNFNGGSDLQLLNNLGPSYPIPLAVQPDGKILASQNAASVYGNNFLFIVRILPDGSVDDGFGNVPPGPPINFSLIDFSDIGGYSYIPNPSALLVQGDGKIVAAGFASSSKGANWSAFVTRLLSDTYSLNPSEPAFNDITRAPLGEAADSNAVGVNGVSIGGSGSGVHVALATQNGKYSTNGSSGPFVGSFTGVNATWASAGDSLALEQMTPTTGGTDTITNVVLGGFWAPNNYEIPLGAAQTVSWKTSTDQPPVASDESLTATSGVVVSGTLSATNPSGGTLSFAIVTPPSHGTATITNATTGAYTYTSTSGYSGSDSFSWKTNDGVADSNTASVTIAVKTTSGSGGSTGSSGGGGGFGVLALLALLLCAGALRWHKQSVRSARWKSVPSTGHLAAGLALSLLVLPVFAAAQWQQVSQGVWLNDIAYGAGRYVATGYTGIYTSSDGVSWQQATLPAESTPDYHRILWNPTLNQFVTVGFSGAVLTSSDGLTWTLHPTGLGTLFDVILADGQYLAVSDQAQVATSPDGVNWTVHTTPADTNYRLLGIAWNGSLYVAAGFCNPSQNCPGGIDADVVLTSADGVNWTRVDPGTGTDPIYADGIAWGNGEFMVVGEAGVITSTDGTNWSRQALDPNYFFEAPNNNALRFDGSRFVATGFDDSPVPRTPTVFTSADGTSWDAHHVPDSFAPDSLLTSAEFINGAYYVSASDGSIFSTPDLANWSTKRAGSVLGNDTYTGIAYGNGRYLAYISPDPVSSAYVSLDGMNWNQQGTRASRCSSIAYGAGLFVCTTQDSGTLYTSPDQDNWVARTAGIGSDTSISNVLAASTGFIAVGVDYSGGNTTSAVLTSPDGISWTAQSSAAVSGVTLNQVIVNASGYFVLGDSVDANGASQTPHLLFSADATDWTELAPDWPDNFNPSALVGHVGTLIAVGTNYRGLSTCPQGACQTEIFTSTDGNHWIQRDVSGLDIPDGTLWMGGSWGGGLFELYGATVTNGNLVFLDSHDSAHWEYTSLPASFAYSGLPYAILWSGNQFITAVGQGGIFRLTGAGLDLTLNAPRRVVSGQTYSYRLRVRNTSATAAATGVTVTDELPAGVQFLSARIRHSSGSCTASGQNVVCTLSEPLDAGARATIRIRVRAPRTSGTLDDHTSIVADQPYTDGSTASANAATVVVCHRHCSP